LGAEVVENGDPETAVSAPEVELMEKEEILWLPLLATNTNPPPLLPPDPDVDEVDELPPGKNFPQETLPTAVISRRDKKEIRKLKRLMEFEKLAGAT
jgi:hypothetical protein